MADASDSTAEEIIELLDLEPHPEGGRFCETWRSAVPEGQRAAGTAIYFLLRAGEVSWWHRVDAAEIWHHGCTVSPGFEFSGFELAPSDWTTPDTVERRVG